MKLILALFLFTIANFALASSISLPIDINNFSAKPADDLTYKSKRIDSYEAFALKKNGFDISTLEPYKSGLYTQRKLSTKTELDEDSSYIFNSYKVSPSEIFRANITGGKNNKRYVLTASLDNHTNIIRAHLLRLIGYDIDIPVYLRTLPLYFKTSKEKTLFLKKLGEETLTNRKKWIHSETDYSVVLKDITLENAELKNMNIYLPVMARSRQKTRRTFRALLALYSITDFPQSINKIDWKVSRSFNGYLSFTHPYASQFKDTTIDDIKWIVQKLNKVSFAEINSVVKAAQYPKEIQSLVSLKLKKRIESLAQHLNLNYQSTDLQLNSNIVVDNKLEQNPDTNRVVNYYQEDARSPYEFRSLLKLFRTQFMYDTFGQLLTDAIEKIVPGQRLDDALDDIQDQMVNSAGQGTKPVKFVAAPTAYVNANASRNIVFGNHMGTSAPIQLVDSVSATVDLGVFANLTGIKDDIIPGINANAGLTRAYTHVRAMPDLEAATDQELKKVLVPRLMKKVGRILNNKFECSLNDDITVVEDILRDEKIIYIKYDKTYDNAKTLAINKREELINIGTNPDIILLVPIDKNQECHKEKILNTNSDINDFLREFALNETFIISDTLNLRTGIKANIPLDTISGQPLVLNTGAEYTNAVLKSTIIKFKEDIVEISLQKQKNTNKSLSIGLNYFIELIKGSQKWINGDMDTKVYNLRTDLDDLDAKQDFIRVMRDILIHNSANFLENNYSPINLDHEIAGKLNTFNIAWYKNQNLNLNHTIEIQLPPRSGFTKEELKKTLFSTSVIKRSGKDFMSFANKILNYFSQYLSIGSEASDPAQSIKGSSRTRYYVTESDISNNIEHPQITTKIDFKWKGWSANKKKLNSIFYQVEKIFPNDYHGYMIDRSKFSSMSAIKNYEIRNTILVYPDFFNSTLKQFNNQSLQEKINQLKYLYTEKKWNRYCRQRQRMRRASSKRTCIPSVVKRFIRTASNKQYNKKEIVRKQNKIVEMLFEGFNRKRALAWMGENNIFSSTRITGFLENTELGYTDYISNTFGTYNSTYGTGIYDSIAKLLGISPYELRALNYTPGM